MGDPRDPTAAEARSLQLLAQAIETSPHNLVSRRARAELSSRHLPECWSFAGLLPERSPVLDLGSGGGLPGLVIAIARPDLRVHLLESTAKKVVFLRETAAALGVHIRVHHGRAEELARGSLRRAFPTITARAVAPLERLVVWAEPYLGPDGSLLAIKGERWSQEVVAAEPALDRLGLEIAADPERDPQLGPTAADPHRPRVVMIGRRS